MKTVFTKSTANPIYDALKGAKGVCFFITDNGYYLRVVTNEHADPIQPNSPPMLVEVFDQDGALINQLGKRYESLTFLCMRLPANIYDSEVSPIPDPTILEIPATPKKQFALSLAF